MGGAQPLAVTMNDGVCIAIEVDEARARRRLEIGYVDRLTHDPAEALAWAREAAARGEADLDRPRRQRGRDRAGLGRGRRAVRPRHGPDVRARRARRLRAGRDDPRRRARRCARTQPDEYERRSRGAMAAHVRAMLAFQRAGAIVFDYGNNLRAQAQEAGVADAFDYPGFVPAFIRPQFCEGRGPFRWAALSAAIRPTSRARTEAILELFPDDAGLRRWIAMAQERVPFQGLPARICWLGYGERAQGRPGVQRAGPDRRGRGPDRHRARPPRRGLGRLAEPRDGGDGRRLGRGRRLAAPQRPRQHGRRRVMGVDPSRRRRRDRLLAARRDGRRRRRHGRSRPRSSSAS